jgi:hypothetical protein
MRIHNVPSHLTSRRERFLERLLRSYIQHEGIEIRIGDTLLSGNLGAAIVAGIRRILAKGQDGHECRRHCRVRGEIVDRRNTLRGLFQLPRNPNGDYSDPETGQRGDHMAA